MADVLLLNADARPVSYLPISTISWKEAIMYLYQDKCTVLEWYDDWMVHSPSWETKVPAVIILKDYIRQRSNVRFSKFNLFLRDEFLCLYCDKQLTQKTATMDHVIPISKGGRTRWDNIVTSCSSCNGKKGNSNHMKPKYEPYRPTYWELVNKRKNLAFPIKHPSWSKWVTQ